METIDKADFLTKIRDIWNRFKLKLDIPFDRHTATCINQNYSYWKWSCTMINQKIGRQR